LLGGRVRGVRISLVVEIMDETGQSPTLRVFAKVLRVSPHRGFYREHVLSKRLTGRVLVHQSERIGPRRKSGWGGHAHQYTAPSRPIRPPSTRVGYDGCPTYAQLRSVPCRTAPARCFRSAFRSSATSAGWRSDNRSRFSSAKTV